MTTGKSAGTIPLSFPDMGERLFSYLLSLYQPQARFPYPLQKGGEGSLLGSAFASFIAFMIGREDELPGAKRLAEAIVGLRDPATGLFSDPGLAPCHFRNPSGHSPFYTTLQSTCFCLSALRCLGGDPDPRMPWLERLLDPGRVERWLDELDWKNPWLVSNLDMFLGIFLLEWQQREPGYPRLSQAVEAYFGWHDLRQVASTGYWGDQQDLLCAMAGAYHIYLHYDYSRRRINHPERAIDATLRLPWRDGLFVYGGGGGSCEDMDGIDILVRLSLLSEHRSQEVARTLYHAACTLALGQGPDGGFSWRLAPDPLAAVARLRSCGATFLTGTLRSAFHKALHRSHYRATHYYSSLSCYPFSVDLSDLWSSWFRPLSLALIAGRHPEFFATPCPWRLPHWPGLGFDPFGGKHPLTSGVARGVAAAVEVAS